MEIAIAKRIALVDISGMWRGVYGYPGLPQPEHFVAHLSDIGGKFDGTITETVRLTRPAPVDVRARVRGSHVAGQVRFAPRAAASRLDSSDPAVKSPLHQSAGGTNRRLSS